MENNQIKCELLDSKSNAIPSGALNVQKELSTDAIPNLDLLTREFLDVLQTVNSDKFKKMSKEQKSMVEMTLIQKHENLPAGLIRLIVEGKNRDEHVQRFVKMCESFQNVLDKKISIKESVDSLSEDIYKNYVYPKFGSKESYLSALKGNKNIKIN